VQHTYDVTSQAFFEAPYPTLRRMREEDPVHWHEPLGVWFITRYADADAVVALGGKTIREGQLVFPVLLAANRDPAAFPDPDRFDIARTGAKHLGFSMGAHYCVGAPLVRLEIEEALRALLEVPRWELGPEGVPYGPYNLSDRGPSALRLGLSG